VATLVKVLRSGLQTFLRQDKKLLVLHNKLILSCPEEVWTG
jgi:hypothetical protein